MPPNAKQSSSSGRPVACLRCRNNRSYCTKERPKCFTCRKGSYECVYSEGRRISVLASYVRGLEERVKNYEALLGDQSEHTAASSQSLPASAESWTPATDSFTVAEPPENSAFDFDAEPLNEGLDNLVISPTGHPHYVGSSSSIILGRKLRDVVGLAMPWDGLEIDREIATVATYNTSALKFRQPPIKDRATLPPEAVAQRYFNAMYSYLGQIFSFINLSDFSSQLQQAYLGSPDINDVDGCLVYCQCFLIMAFGQMYAGKSRSVSRGMAANERIVNQYMDSEGPPGYAYFTQAVQYLPELHEEPSTLFCGVLALIGYFMQNLNRRDAAFMYLGLAQRMAISLALHEEVSLPGLDEITKEQRRRTWWSIYSLDRILCVKYGNPVTMHDEDISAALPSKLPHESDYCPATVLRHYTMLSRTLSQIMEQIYRKTPKSGSTLLASIQEIMSSLTEWQKSVPYQLQFDPKRITASRESVSTFLHYYACITMTGRPLLLHIVKIRLQTNPHERSNDWKQGLAQSTISMVETCIFAARDAISMMSLAAKNEKFACFGYMDTEHAVSSTLILVMVAIAFPHDDETMTFLNLGLHLLRDVASKGNHHIEARLRMLTQLLSATGTITSENEGLLPTSAPYEVPGPVLNGGVLDQMFTSTPGAGDLHMFEAAYLESDLNIEFDFSQWTNSTAPFLV